MIGTCRRKLATKVGLLAAVVGATCVWTVPTAVAVEGPPQGGGGCHMVLSPSSMGLNNELGVVRQLLPASAPSIPSRTPTRGKFLPLPEEPVSDGVDELDRGCFGFL